MARSKLALWGALAVLVLGIGALVVTSAGDDGERALLPLALGGAGDDRAEGRGAPTAAGDAMLYQPVHYTAGDDLPVLGGDGPVYRLPNESTEADVRRLADALGLDAPVGREGDGWVVQDGEAQLRVYGSSWSYAGHELSGEGSSGSSTGCVRPAEPTGEAGDDVVVDCVEPDKPVEPERPADLPTADEARQIVLDIFEQAGIDTDGADVRVDDYTTAWGVWVEPVVDGYKTIGLANVLSVGSGGDINDGGGMLGTFELVDDYPMIDTREAIDRLNDTGGSYYGGEYYGGPVALADGGGDVAVSSGEATVTGGSPDASVAKEEPTTTTATACIMIYPPPPGCEGGDDTPDTTEACKVQPDGREICEDPNSGSSEPGGAGSGGTDPAEPPDTTIVCEPQADGTEPCIKLEPVPAPEPAPEPEPIEVTLTDAEVVLTFTGAWDGSASYLVPAYRMDGTDADGIEHEATALAIDDAFLKPPSTTTVPGGSGDGTEPAPMPAEEDACASGVTSYDHKAEDPDAQRDPGACD